MKTNIRSKSTVLTHEGLPSPLHVVDLKNAEAPVSDLICCSCCC